MSVQQENNPTKSFVDGVTTPLLNGQPHGGKSTGYLTLNKKLLRNLERMYITSCQKGYHKSLCDNCRSYNDAITKALAIVSITLGEHFADEETL